MHDPVALVTVLALFVYLWQLARVGKARGRLGVAAPAITGNPEFERHFRVQANTLESLPVFLTALWLFAIYTHQDLVAAALGAVWIVGRIIYTLAYAKAAETRGMGFGIQGLAMVILLLGAAGAIVWTMIRVHG